MCQGCGNLVRNPADQYTKRVELRRIDGRRRLSVETIAYLCLTCARAMVAAGKVTDDSQLTLEGLRSSPDWRDALHRTT